MAKTYHSPFMQPLYPSLEGWHQEEKKMWPILMKHLEPIMRTRPLADVLLAAYLLGLNHMVTVLDNASPAPSKEEKK